MAESGTDDGCLELDSLELGHAQPDFARSRTEILFVMTGMVALVASRLFILVGTNKFVHLIVEQGIQCFSTLLRTGSFKTPMLRQPKSAFQKNYRNLSYNGHKVKSMVR